MYFDQYNNFKVKEENYIPWKIRNALHNIGHTVNVKKVFKNCGKRTSYILKLMQNLFAYVYNKYIHN